MEGLVKTLATLISGGVIGYLIKHVLALQYVKKVEELNKKRFVYEVLTETLGVFISGRTPSDEQKDLFLNTYSKCWLWASDAVVKEIGNFLDTQIALAKGEDARQECMKQKYVSCLIAMRKDIGFSRTRLKDEDHKFVRF